MSTSAKSFRRALPRAGGPLFLTDGGLETTLIFHDGLDLPLFASFDLMKSTAGVEALRRYFIRYAMIAQARGVGFVLDTPTWRANGDWGARLGYDTAALADVNRRSVDLMVEIRAAHETASTPMVISGAIGPRGDGYVAERRMSANESREYHAAQIRTFAACATDFVAAYTMNYVDEALGIGLAARDAGIPVVLSFTLETDGRLPSGETLEAAIERTDYETGGYPSYYMINCAHPTHFSGVLPSGAAWLRRIHGVRANASKRSHAELDASPDLDAGDPVQLAHEYLSLREQLPQLTVVGGCCGTDHRHVEAIGDRLLGSNGTPQAMR